MTQQINLLHPSMRPRREWLSSRRACAISALSAALMVAHVVLITLGYAATSRTGVVGELWALVVSYPGMLVKFAVARRTGDLVSLSRQRQWDV